MTLTKTLRKLINSKEIHIAPGVFDGLSARLVEQQGFKLIYASGGAIARSSGRPDIGLLSMSEVCARLADMVEVTNLPIIADADTGFGNVLNVRRTVQSFERIGVAGLHLEDQTFPKRCGHLAGKSLISKAAMCEKIKIATDSRNDKDFVIIARTDAIAVEGFEPALERAHAYLAAGADMIFVEAPETEQQIADIAKQISSPKLINMFYGGKTPLVNKALLQKMGYNIIIIPSDLQRAAIHAMQNTLKAIDANGDSSQLAQHIATFNEREQIIGTESYLAITKDLKES